MLKLRRSKTETIIITVIIIIIIIQDVHIVRIEPVSSPALSSRHGTAILQSHVKDATGKNEVQGASVLIVQQARK